MNIKETLKNNITLVIGLSIPILMILFVTGSIYLPRLFTTTQPPHYSFLYTIGGDYSSKYYYSVENGRLLQNPTPKPAESVYNAPIKTVTSEGLLFKHDVTTNVSTQISCEEAQKFTLITAVFSPDGFEIVSPQGGGFPFSGPYDYMSKYIKKGTYAQKLNLNLGESNYWQYNFLGWIAQ